MRRTSLDCSSDQWAERGTHWADAGRATSTDLPGSLVPKVSRAPLVLTGHGMRLRINHGALEIRKGHTHHPQVQTPIRFFKGDSQRPSRIILVEGSGALSLEVLAWLSTQDIPLVQVDYRGTVVSAVGPAGQIANAVLMQAQLGVVKGSTTALSISSWLIREKLQRSFGVLEDLIPQSNLRVAGLARMVEQLARLRKCDAQSVDELLGIEGYSALGYFRAWREVPVHWKGIGRHPIPEAWHRVGPRTSARNVTNHFASHPVHAMLNYGYAILEGETRLALLRLGFDLSIGFFHASRPGRPALVLDMLEPLRAAVDRRVLGFVRETVFAPNDFTLSSDGVCRLHPQLARHLVGTVGSFLEIDALCVELASKLGYRPPEKIHARHGAVIDDLIRADEHPLKPKPKRRRVVVF